MELVSSNFENFDFCAFSELGEPPGSFLPTLEYFGLPKVFFYSGKK
jgi:hypothetical protein